MKSDYYHDGTLKRGPGVRGEKKAMRLSKEIPRNLLPNV